jgi:hypothetical protein
LWTAALPDRSPSQWLERFCLAYLYTELPVAKFLGLVDSGSARQNAFTVAGEVFIQSYL